MAVVLSLCALPTAAASAATPTAVAASLPPAGLERDAEEGTTELKAYLGQTGVTLDALLSNIEEYDEETYVKLFGRKADVTFTSSNEKVATIGYAGAIECLTAGTTTLTATVNTTGETFTWLLNVMNGVDWTAAAFTAVIGQEPTYPTLSYPSDAENVFWDIYSGTKNVDYTSSNEEVAGIDKAGVVTIYTEGTTTITAHINKTENHGAFDVSYLLTVTAYEVTGSSETIHVNEPGGLRYALADIESTAIGRLTLTGRLGSDDLNVLFQHAGRLSNLQVLDMQGVELVPDDGLYASNSRRSDIGMGSSTNQYYLSTRGGVEHSSSATGLGGGKHISKHYTMNLSGLFCGNTSIVRVVMPRSVERVGNYTFSGCSALQEVDVAEGVTEVEECAFASCGNLRKHNLTSLRTIGENAFSNAFVRDVDLSHVDSLGAKAFYGSSIRRADLSALAVIPKDAFQNCTELTEVKFGNNTIEIKEYAFACTGLTDALLPDGLITLGEGAFMSSNVETLSIPATLRFVARSCFSGTPWFLAQTPVAEVVYADHVALSVSGSSTITTLSLREGTTAIAAYFCPYDYTSLTSVSFPASLKVIGDMAFYYSRSLAYALPSGLEWIGHDAFYGNTATTSLTVPASVEHVGQAAFSGSTALLSVDYNARRADSRVFSDCTALEKVSIGASVELIPYEAFEGCSSLLKVSFGEGMATKAAGNAATSLIFDDFCFYGTLLRTVDFPARTDSIGQKAFYDTQLTEANLIRGVRSVGAYAFAACTSLKTVYLPKNLETLDASAFHGDPVTAIYSYRDTPPTIVGTTKNFTDLAETARVYTKYDDVYTYDADPVWTNFVITDMDEAHLALSIGGVKGNVSNDNSIYDLSGRRVKSPRHGPYIVGGKKVMK